MVSIYHVKIHFFNYHKKRIDETVLEIMQKARNFVEKYRVRDDLLDVHNDDDKRDTDKRLEE